MQGMYSIPARMQLMQWIILVHMQGMCLSSNYAASSWGPLQIFKATTAAAIAYSSCTAWTKTSVTLADENEQNKNKKPHHFGKR